MPLRRRRSRINNRGKVVGEYLDRHGVYHGYVWANGRFATIDGPLGTGASIVDVNDRGDKVGTYFAEDGTADGFLLRHGEYTTFAALGLPFTLPFDINNRGQIAGLAFSDPDMTELHGFLLAKGADGPVTQVDVPGAPRTAVFGLDDRGRLVGVYENPDAPSARQREPRPAALPARRAATRPRAIVSGYPPGTSMAHLRTIQQCGWTHGQCRRAGWTDRQGNR